jgi:hypothetical protein
VAGSRGEQDGEAETESKDVLGQSLEEIGALLVLSVPAVKAALHRGRSSLRAQSDVTPAPARRISPEIERYAALFNARDWDGVRTLLADDVRLDLVSRSQRAGRRAVGGYFTNYAASSDWYFVPARLEGREVLAAFRDPADERAGYLVELTFVNGQVTVIRDFRYVPYIMVDAAIEVVNGQATHPEDP